MSATTLRVIGFLFLVAAAVVAVMSLKRVANLGMVWLAAPLLIVGVGLLGASRRKAWITDKAVDSVKSDNSIHETARNDTKKFRVS